jgi:hypothetical protein
MSSANCILHLSVALVDPVAADATARNSRRPFVLSLLCLCQFFSGGSGYNVGGEAEFFFAVL